MGVRYTLRRCLERVVKGFGQEENDKSDLFQEMILKNLFISEKAEVERNPGHRTIVEDMTAIFSC